MDVGYMRNLAVLQFAYGIGEIGGITFIIDVSKVQQPCSQDDISALENLPSRPVLV